MASACAVDVLFLRSRIASPARPGIGKSTYREIRKLADDGALPGDAVFLQNGAQP
jgi:hypothetical protein